jgi:hypothetical protein
MPLQPDGVRLSIPTSDGDGSQELTIEIQGMIRFGYNGTAYDALYACDSSGAADPAQPHAYLSWQPYAPSLVESDVRDHRYRFRFERLARGVSPSVRVDVDRFVNDFLISPSEVRSSLSGQLFITTEAAAAPAFPWRYVVAAAPALLLTGGVAWVIRRRMAGALDYDLLAQLHRIHEKARAARQAVRPEDRRLVPVSERMKVLETGADRLARQIQQIRAGRALHNRAQLERDAKLLAQRTSVDPSNEELLETLVVKRKSLQQLAELEQAEHRLTGQLSKIEAVLENTLAGLQNVGIADLAGPARESVCRALDAEVSALREAAQQPADADLLGRNGA